MDSSFRQSHPHNLFLKHRTTRQERGHGDKHNTAQVTNTAGGTETPGRGHTDTDTQKHRAAWEVRPEAAEGAEGVGGSQGGGTLMVLQLLPRAPGEAQGSTRGSRPWPGCHRGGSQEKGPSRGRASSKRAQERSKESLHPQLCSARHQSLPCSEDVHYSQQGRAAQRLM